MKKGIILLTFTLMVLITTACSSQPDIDSFEILNRRDNQTRVAYVDGDHWHGSLPTVAQGHSISLGANITTADGETIELDSADETNGLTVSLHEGALDGLVSFETHGDHVYIRGIEEGTTQVVFNLVQNGKVTYTTPAINVTIGEADEVQQEIHTFDLLDRHNDNERVAYVHDDHWDGSIPTITIGESISLGAFIVSVDERERELDPDGEVNGFVVLLAPHVPEGKVSLENHGDHVYIYGIEAGITQVIFQWVHRGEVRYTSPPINVYITQ